MKNTDTNYEKCLNVLKEELLPAMGCTEPIAISYCAAVARETLGDIPDRIVIEASGNIIKNVKSVVVPNTGNMKGITAAAAAGVIAGNAEKKLEVISTVSEKQIEAIKDYLNNTEIEVVLSESPYIFDIYITVYKNDNYAKVRIVNYHTNIVHIEKDGKTLQESVISCGMENGLTDRSFLSVELILDFANSVDISDVKDLLDTQIQYNIAIAEEGLKNSYGANIGSVLLAHNENSLRLRAKAMAAAGSDARMNGCDMPVIINSGSGNQGITASVPVIVYARDMKVSDEKMYRALVLSNLIAIHQKTRIGRLSAYCGAINAGAAAGCGIAYLMDGSLDAISHTLVNALAISSGVICDGAKASCAGKIAVAVDTGILGYEMYCDNQQFYGGDGIVKKGAENTLVSVGRLGHDGMKETDIEILNIMIDK
ncbi:MAG: serine dehydratase subunit alpha family protein [Oscillospiraceae bacterium]|nr:serine dehydratase subunit alpha family protein [Oscillospiraceae bacterium]